MDTRDVIRMDTQERMGMDLEMRMQKESSSNLPRNIKKVVSSSSSTTMGGFNFQERGRFKMSDAASREESTVQNQTAHRL